MTKKKAPPKKSAASLAPTRLGGSTAALPGLENPAIEEVSNAALTMWEAQLEASAAKKRVEEASAKVQTVLAAHSLKRYRDAEHELFVEIVASKAKVKLLHGTKKKRGRK